MNYLNPTSSTIPFYSCCNLNDKTRKVAHNVINDINMYLIFNLSLHDKIYTDEHNGYNTICSFDDRREAYAYTIVYGTEETDILVSNELLDYDNVLYNVVLHEFLHALGLNHTEENGVMSYKIYTNEKYEILEDRRKLYLSYDDMKGLYEIKRKYNLI